MAGAPAFEETVEVGPGDGEEGAPFGFDGFAVTVRLFFGEGLAEVMEVEREEFGLLFFAGVGAFGQCDRPLPAYGTCGPLGAWLLVWASRSNARR